jgi:hypothetical protein
MSGNSLLALGVGWTPFRRCDAATRRRRKIHVRAERSPMRWFLVGDYEDVAGEPEQRAVGDQSDCHA